MRRWRVRATRLLALFWIPALALACSRAGRLELSIPPLEGGQPLVEKLVGWDGGLAAITAFEGVFFAAPDADRFEKLRIPGCDRILGVATAGSGPIVLCLRGGGLEIVPKREPRQAVAVPLDVDELGARMTASDARLAVATSRAVAIRSGDSDWRTVGTPSPAEHSAAFPPQHLLFAQGTLWLGWNLGEFGGGLYRLKLAGVGSLPEPELVREMNVLGIEKGSGDEIWVAGGIAHLGVRRASLLLIREGRVAAVALEHEGFMEGPSFSAFTVSAQQVPVVVEDRTGIHEFRDGGLQRVVGGEFSWSREKPRSTVLYGTLDVLAWPDGRFFLATNGLGVLEIPASGTPVRQLRLRD